MAPQPPEPGQSPQLHLGDSVRALEGVGDRRARLLKRLDIHTVSDLLRHIPLRYETHWAEGSISELPKDGVGSARGTIVNCRFVQAMGRFGKGRFEATLQDHSARLNLVWFNAGYLRGKLHPGMVLRVSGKVGYFNGYAQMVNPRWEELTDAQQTPAVDEHLRPVYPATEDLPGSVIESLIAQVLPRVLPNLPDPLPSELTTRHDLPTLAQAYQLVYRPADEADAHRGRRRLAYNELLLLQLGIALKRQYNRTALAAPALRWSKAIDQHIRQRFPFDLTPAQKHVVNEIAADLQHPVPMNRLLQGDVGSGKTVVALYALLMAVADRRQGAIMTPTELLAEQHFASISRMLEGSNVRLALLTGGGRADGRRAAALKGVADGSVDIVIGTQALLTESVRFHDLAVVVIDEQHRFGVLQRAAFREAVGDKADAATGPRRSPHYLVMTATPIPRTLSLTLFGDLDVSVIDQLPPGRSPIATRVVPPEKSDEVYRYMAQRVRKGEQAYIVVPTIDGGDSETTRQLKDLQSHLKLIQQRYCEGLVVEAVHGRLKQATRDQVMERFRRNEVHVLVATTVIEVGVDVPNATMMVVEHAERFGLAQLHQLRGRIGRGVHRVKSVCVFIAQPTTQDAQKRMAAIAGTTDGFKIAEADLEVRGIGDFFGTRQHGLPPLRSARIPQDMLLLSKARTDAQQLVSADPTLSQPAHLLLRKVLMQAHGDSLGLVDVG